MQIPQGWSILQACQETVCTPGQDLGEQLAIELASRVSKGEITLTMAAYTLMGRTRGERHTLMLEKLFTRVPGGMELAAAVSYWTAGELKTQLKTYDAKTILIMEKRQRGAEPSLKKQGTAPSNPERSRDDTSPLKMNKPSSRTDRPKNGFGGPKGTASSEEPPKNSVPSRPPRVDDQTWEKMSREERTELIEARRQWKGKKSLEQSPPTAVSGRSALTK